MKVRPDSLYRRLEKKELLHEFFGWVAAEAPTFKEMMSFCRRRHIRTSTGAISNLITYHMGIWRTQQALQAADEAVMTIPEGSDTKLVERIHGLKFDLTMRDLTAPQQIKVWQLDQAERELAMKNQNQRDVAVDALLKEADGNEKAKAALAEFLAALDDAGKGTVGAGLVSAL